MHPSQATSTVGGGHWWCLCGKHMHATSCVTNFLFLASVFEIIPQNKYKANKKLDKAIARAKSVQFSCQ